MSGRPSNDSKNNKHGYVPPQIPQKPHPGSGYVPPNIPERPKPPNPPKPSTPSNPSSENEK